MKRMRCVFVMAISTSGCLYVPISPSESGISRVAVEGTNYCHLRFPAIREDTLFSSRPELKDTNDGDLIYLYGPCDYDPLGAEEIRRQREDVRRNRRID